MNGNGIYLDKEGDKIYEGEWKDGLYNGKGIIYDKRGVKIYDGEWKDNL